MSHTLGFLGFGRLVQALYTGFSPFLQSQEIPVYASKKTAFSADIDGLTACDIPTLLSTCSLVIVAVKPQQLPEILPELSQYSWENTCLVSVLAGTPLSVFESAIQPLSHAIRVMPNTSAEFKQSMSVFSASASTDSSYVSFISDLFSTVGSVLPVKETQFDFCTSLCGSGPAFFYRLCEACIFMAKDNGFSDEDARLMVNQLVAGVSASLNGHDASISSLVKAICSPNGTTEAGLKSLDNQDVQGQWMGIFKAATERAKELSKYSLSH